MSDWREVRTVRARLSVRFPRLAMCWHILRGWPVAYRIRIENGGLVLDDPRPAMVTECVIIGTPPPPPCPACGTTQPDLRGAAVTIPSPGGQ